MLRPADEPHVHEPIAADPGLAPHADWFERVTFFGHDDEGALVFGVTLARYPGRRTTDASFAAVIDGRRSVVRASGRADPERPKAAIGPFTIETLEPDGSFRVTVADPDDALGVRMDAVFTARTTGPVRPDAPADGRDAPRVRDEAQRVAQWGEWSGRVVIDGEAVDLVPAAHRGIRERSWGLGAVGQPIEGAPHRELPEVLSVDLLLGAGAEGRCWTIRADDNTDGRRRWWQGAAVDVATGAVDDRPDAAIAIAWQPGTRWVRSAELHLPSSGAAGAPAERCTLTTLAALPLRDLGRFDPHWHHGLWHGELVVATERSAIDQLDPTSVHDLGLVQVVRAEGDITGTGLLSVLALGPHTPSGLAGFTTGGQA